MTSEREPGRTDAEIRQAGIEEAEMLFQGHYDAAWYPALRDRIIEDALIDESSTPKYQALRDQKDAAHEARQERAHRTRYLPRLSRHARLEHLALRYVRARRIGDQTEIQRLRPKIDRTLGTTNQGETP